MQRKEEHDDKIKAWCCEKTLFQTINNLNLYPAELRKSLDRNQ